MDNHLGQQQLYRRGTCGQSTGATVLPAWAPVWEVIQSRKFRMGRDALLLTQGSKYGQITSVREAGQTHLSLSPNGVQRWTRNLVKKWDNKLRMTILWPVLRWSLQLVLLWVLFQFSHDHVSQRTLTLSLSLPRLTEKDILRPHSNPPVCEEGLQQS